MEGIVTKGLMIAFIGILLLLFLFILWCTLAMAQKSDDNSEAMGIELDEYKDMDGV